MVLAVVRRIAWGLVLLAACSPERSDDELFAPGGLGVPVVDGLLVVGKRFGDIYLSQTIAPDQAFDRNRDAIDNAQVTVEGAGVVITYVSFIPGHYRTGAPDTVQASTTYQMTAVLPDGRVVRASTTTPAQLDIDQWVLLDNAGTSVIRQLKTFEEDSSSVYDQPENQLVYTEGILAAALENQSNVGYQIGLVNLETDSELLIDTSFLDEEDLDNFRRVNSSPPLDYEATLRIPWLAIYYEGRYNLRVVALDRNWFDIVRTDPALGAGGFGFGGEAGDTSTRPIFHVEGGIGVFGSVSSDSVGFYVHAAAHH